MNALFTFENYTAVIPHIQNVYGPERDRNVGWCVGFKYQSQVFEFWSFRTIREARKVHAALLAAVDQYWSAI